MNESETRAEYIDPLLKAAGWGEIDGSRVLREFRITDGKIQVGGQRSKPEIADYVLVYKIARSESLKQRRLIYRLQRASHKRSPTQRNSVSITHIPPTAKRSTRSQ
jgi:hypothetical protein